MSSEREIVLVLLVFVLNGIEACFQTNEQQIKSVTTGSTFYEECQCEEPGYNNTHLQWLYNGAPIPLSSGPGTHAKMYTDNSNSETLELHIPFVTKEMSGTYKCVTHFQNKIYSQTYSLTAYDPLYFYDTPNDQHLVYERTSSIMCQPRSDANVMITWQKENENGEAVDVVNDAKFVSGPHGLTVYNVTDDDAGTYKCTARVVETNEEVDKNIVVQVMTVPEIKRIKTNAIDDFRSIKVVAGNNLIIECIANGRPHPEYIWNRTLSIDSLEPNETWHQEINSLIFDEVKPEDSGVYTCSAFNDAGTDTMDVPVEVLVPPYIVNFNNETAVENTPIQMFCNASGVPFPIISIQFNGTDWSDDDDENLDYFENMKEITVGREHEGIYICNATNAVDSVKKEMYLTVLHKPYFEEENETLWGWEGKTVTFNCDHDSNPEASVTWSFQDKNMPPEDEIAITRKLIPAYNSMPDPTLFTMTIDNTTTYGVYVCIATNAYGTATKTFKLVEGFRPGALERITPKPATATSITFELEGENYTDRPKIIGFRATYDEEKNFNITDIHINRTWAIDRPCKLDKLKSNTTYWVKFAAVNEVGHGTWSTFYEFRTLEKSVPDAPVWDDEPILLSENSHVLKWQEPNDNGEPLDYYTLKYCPEDDDDTCKTKKITPTSKLEIDDLEFNTTYVLELIAHNAQGDSVPANVSIFVPAPLLNSPIIQLSGGAIIVVSIVIVVLLLLLLDVILLVWRRQGIIATCCFKKKKECNENLRVSRVEKCPLTNGESEDQCNVRNNGHREYEYNKNTGIVTGKHSSV